MIFVNTIDKCIYLHDYFIGEGYTNVNKLHRFKINIYVTYFKCRYTYRNYSCFYVLMMISYTTIICIFEQLKY